MEPMTAPAFTPAAVAAANRILPRLREIVREYGPSPYPASYTENTVSGAEVRHAADAPYGNGGGVLARANARTILAFVEDADEAAERASDGVPADAADAADAAAIPVYRCRQLHYDGVEFAPAFLLLAEDGSAEPAEWRAAADAIDAPREAAAAGVEIHPLECGHGDIVSWMRGVAALFSEFRAASEGSQVESACGELIESLVDSSREFAAMLAALEEYPVLDDDALCHLEADEEADAWDDGGAMEFAHAILARLEGNEWERLHDELGELNSAEAAQSEALCLRHAEAGAAAPYPFYTHESCGVYFDADRAAELVAAEDRASLAAELRGEREAREARQ
jgi:hypothetical protein